MATKTKNASKIKVRIQGEATVAFDQIKEMTVAEFRELEEDLDAGKTGILECWIDARDVDDIRYDAHDFTTDKVLPR